MINLKRIGNSFEESFLRSFLPDNKENILLPEQTRKNMYKKLGNELYDINNKYGLEGYGHILYLIGETKAVQKHKDGYVVFANDKNYKSYIFLDKHLNLDTSGVFFFRYHISSDRKNAILFNNNKIISFSQSNDNTIFNIEEKESKEQTLSYSSNFSNISLKTKEFSINSFSLSKIDSYNINIKGGYIKKKDNSIVIEFDNGKIERNINTKAIDFTLNHYSASFISNLITNKEIIYSYDSIKKDIFVTYPVEYNMKNKKEDIKEFFEMLSLISDSSELPNGSVYLNNLNFFENLFSKLESCKDITSIINAKNNYDSVFKDLENLNTEIEKNITSVKNKKNKL